MNVRKILETGEFNVILIHSAILAKFLVINFFVKRLTRFGDVSTPYLILGILIESSTYLVVSYRFLVPHKQDRGVYEHGMYISILGIMAVPVLLFLYGYQLSSAYMILLFDGSFLVYYTIKLFRFSRERTGTQSDFDMDL